MDSLFLYSVTNKGVFHGFFALETHPHWQINAHNQKLVASTQTDNL